MSYKVFISRDLKSNSPFQKLESDRCRIIAKSLIEIAPVNIRSYPSTDWIFFYSANGVKYFFKTNTYSTDFQYAVMGPSTSNIFFEITGYSPKYTGNGIPKDIANNFITYESGQSILFVKAKNSKDSIKELISENMVCHDLVTYKNTIKLDFEIPPCSHLVFTSPMNAKAYFDKYSYKGEKLFAIGESTFNTVTSITNAKCIMPESPSMQNLYQIVEHELKQDRNID